MKLLLQSNIPKFSNYRKGLLSTLKRSENLLVKQINLGEDLEKACDGFIPDVYLSVKQKLDHSMWQLLKRIGCKTIQLFRDDPDEFEKGLIIARQYDYYFTNSEKVIEKYKENGINAKLCYFAIDEKMVEDVKPQDKYKCDIIFAGGDNKKRYRYTYLNALKGLDLKVFGKFNKDVYGKQDIMIYDSAEYFSALKSAKIGIDFSESGAGFMNVKSKTFELAAAGCLIMANKFKEMKNCFEYGKEIIGFTSPEDLRAKCEYYLSNSGDIIGERLAIARAGHERFLKEHNWKKRLDFVFKECNIDVEV
jgi:spore maturation protein CgeB